jgi:hypothetical protein
MIKSAGDTPHAAHPQHRLKIPKETTPMTIDGVRGGQPVTAQQMLDAVATEGKAKGLNDEQIAKLQLALQGLIDTKGVEGALLELADGSARIDAGEMNKSLDNASRQMRGTSSRSWRSSSRWRRRCARTRAPTAKAPCRTR